jgi:glycerol-3-phosphate dehydrogenase
LNKIIADIVVLGGGIAGLWTLTRLRQQGYAAILLETAALGSGQTIASQGMIHGGLKYALGGNMTSAANSIADMPDYWRLCLTGSGEIDLRNTNLLSDTYYLWPKASSLRSRFTAFMGSKMLHGKVDSVPADERPNFSSAFPATSLYRLRDIVLDIPSLLRNLLHINKSAIFHCPQYQLEWSIQGYVEEILLRNEKGTKIRIKPGHVLATAGNGNAELIQRVSKNCYAMQQRPLQMVVVKHHYTDPLFVHMVSEELTATPELTLTTHPCRDGRTAWYLGGELAERGSTQGITSLLEDTRALLSERLPNYNLSNATFACFPLQRAEARQPGGKRPDLPTVQTQANFSVAWPTKLTMAPMMANAFITTIEASGLDKSGIDQSPTLPLTTPAIATPLWDTF